MLGGLGPNSLQRTLFRAHAMTRLSSTAGNVATTVEVHNVAALASEIDRAPHEAFLCKGDDDLFGQANEAQFRPAEPRRIGLPAGHRTGHCSTTEWPRKIDKVGLRWVLIPDFWRRVRKIRIRLAGKVLQLRLAAPEKPVVIDNALAKLLDVVCPGARGQAEFLCGLGIILMGVNECLDLRFETSVHQVEQSEVACH